MATIQVTVSPEQLLQIVAQMPADELAEFTANVLAVKARHTAATLTTTEENLLKEIYGAELSTAQQTRLQELASQLEADDQLPIAEQQELHQLTAQSEAQNVIRIKKVTELANLWQKPVPAVMKQLGLWQTYEP